MVKVSKEEKRIILDRYPTMYFYSSKHHIYAEERGGPMALLARIRKWK